MKELLLLSALLLPLRAQTPAAEDASAPLAVLDGSLFLDLHDPGNHAWMLRSSPDLANWTDEGSYRPFNGRLRIPLPVVPGPRFFTLDSGRAGGVSSAAAEALIQPETPRSPPTCSPPRSARRTTPRRTIP